MTEEKTVEKVKKVKKPKVIREKRDPKRHYVRNKDLLPEIERCRDSGKISRELGRMLLLIVENYSKKSNWSNYTYRDDMKGHAMVHLSNAALKFDPMRSNNPFAYYTQITKNAFIQILKQEKKHRDIRDAQLVDNGLDPSYAFQQHYKDEQDAKKEERALAANGQDDGDSANQGIEAIETPTFENLEASCGKDEA